MPTLNRIGELHAFNLQKKKAKKYLCPLRGQFSLPVKEGDAAERRSAAFARRSSWIARTFHDRNRQRIRLIWGSATELDEVVGLRKRWGPE
jgi:hypothetical protein